jgi:hypothetical protein
VGRADPDGVDYGETRPPATEPVRRKFLSVWYRCCHVYGRMYRNQAGTAYTGRCPRCAAHVRAAIGPDGTDRRMFVAE